MTGSPQMLAVEVVYALPERQWLQRLDVPAGTTVAQVLAQCELVRDGIVTWPFQGLEAGVWFERCPDPEAVVVQDGDRISLLRPLLIDPMESRRLRAEQARKRRQAGAG